jgi:CHAT domain-containing protein
VLSARELARLDVAPALVFSNACDSGRVAPPQAVPSFAEVLLGLGVEHMIATARPVQDRAALSFATAFWQNARQPVYLALAAARQAAGDQRALWQHYGDPVAVLVSD